MRDCELRDASMRMRIRANHRIYAYLSFIYRASSGVEAETACPFSVAIGASFRRASRATVLTSSASWSVALAICAA